MTKEYEETAQELSEVRKLLQKARAEMEKVLVLNMELRRELQHAKLLPPPFKAKAKKH